MPDNWTTVATFQDTIAAAVAKNFLDNEGIPSILLDEATVATDWMLSTAIGGIKLQVAPHHLERAELLLVQIRETQDEQAANTPVPDANAGQFASAEIAEDLQSDLEDKQPINELTDKLFRTTVFGYIIWPLQAYALFLMLQIATSEGKVSPKRRWKIWLSVVLNVPILMVVIVPLLCLQSWLPGNAGTPDQPIWRRHSYPSLKFSVKFPHEPRPSERNFDGFSAQHYSTRAKHRTYEITYVKNYVRDRAPLDNEELAKLVQGHAFANSSNVIKSAIAEHKGISGVEYRLAHRNYFERGRIFIRANDAIHLIAQSGDDDLADTEPQQFFDSLTWR